MDYPNTYELPINKEIDIALARRHVRDFAQAMGFGMTDMTRIITSVAELARNIFIYANTGTVQYRKIENGRGIGLELIFQDHGPGIADLEQAMVPGYSTSKGLGLGLPGTKRLMDEMIVLSENGNGTLITIRKWLKR